MLVGAGITSLVTGIQSQVNGPGDAWTDRPGIGAAVFESAGNRGPFLGRFFTIVEGDGALGECQIIRLPANHEIPSLAARSKGS